MASFFKVLIIITIAISLSVGLFASITATFDHRLAYLAAKVLRGEAVQYNILRDALLTSTAHPQSCATSHLSTSVIVRLRVLETLSSLQQIKELDLEDTILNFESKELLVCQPTDAFTWLLQFWLNTISGKADLSNWKFLERSYEAGLYEGWIAARRSRIAVASLDLAPDTLQTKAVQEFKALLRYNFGDEGVRLYASASVLAKRRLGEAIKMLDVVQRQSFTTRLEPSMPPELLIDAIGGLTNRASSSRKSLP